ncbi:MAG TPA: winged helix-turn-helix transcriptional regulator [Nitrososphaeraceae archaeon]|jgi:DNA-binding Lrp family transcriptional regulator
MEMPLQLDNYDILILKSLLKDGRKSFREISRETGITTPTVKARFSRLVNVGFIKSVSPIFDFDMVERENILRPTLKDEQNKGEDSRAKEDENRRNNNNYSRINPQQQQQDGRLKIKKGLKIKLDCEFCKGPITSHPHVFRFANYERFFCCTGCMSGYKQKYAGRIESIKRKFADIE